ncbi:hypothetical protein K402DRAFT_382837 [Aulographum hederae CBS 113979]|uniref:Uncharacterized protein n=1 Tax=Aulographum hederae CBS 113979 TaxID=1176131 RepID=A0A6G1GRG7_9PEZI|nr:hypothetical protein K402DRAFT_382837 [Aulographum hederae CBS 113979]
MSDPTTLPIPETSSPLTTTLTILSYLVYGICYPIYILLYYFLVCLKPLLYVLYLIVLPVVYLAGYVADVGRGVWRVLGRFETLYIYLSTAFLVGLVAGGILYLTSSFLSSILGLDSDSQPDKPTRSIADFRANRKTKKAPGRTKPLYAGAGGSYGRVSGTRGVEELLERKESVKSWAKDEDWDQDEE